MSIEDFEFLQNYFKDEDILNVDYKQIEKANSLL